MRLRDIVCHAHFYSADIVILPGTRIKGNGNLEPVKRIYGYILLSWGYSEKQPGTNSHAGGAILLWQGRFKEDDILEVWDVAS